MKKYLLTILAVMMVGGIAFASVGVKNSSSMIGTAADINCSKGITCAMTNDGANIYLGAVVVDADLYTSSVAGVGASKSLRISADGTIYAF